MIPDVDGVGDDGEVLLDLDVPQDSSVTGHRMDPVANSLTVIVQLNLMTLLEKCILRLKAFYIIYNRQNCPHATYTLIMGSGRLHQF